MTSYRSARISSPPSPGVRVTSVSVFTEQLDIIVVLEDVIAANEVDDVTVPEDVKEASGNIDDVIDDTEDAIDTAVVNVNALNFNFDDVIGGAADDVLVEPDEEKDGNVVLATQARVLAVLAASTALVSPCFFTVADNPSADLTDDVTSTLDGVNGQIVC